VTRRSLPLLFVAALGLVAGAIKAWDTGALSPLSCALISAGLVTLGAWIGQEVASSLKVPPTIEERERDGK
jgi:hypothetical protein